jgi:hypothetical protein
VVQICESDQHLGMRMTMRCGNIAKHGGVDPVTRQCEPSPIEELLKSS